MSALAALFVLVVGPAGAALIPGLVPGGDFQVYKPDTGFTVTGAFADGSSWGKGVGVGGASVTSGTVNFSDGTSGGADTVLDLPGWAPLQSGNDLMYNGVDGSTGLNIFATWGGHGRIQSAASLGTIESGKVYTISAMVNGPDTGPIQGPLALHLLADGVQLTPSAVVDPTLPGYNVFQQISRTYDAGSIAGHVGASMTIVVGVEDDNSFGNRVIFDNVMIIPEPATLSVLALGGLALLAAVRSRQSR